MLRAAAFLPLFGLLMAHAGIQSALAEDKVPAEKSSLTPAQREEVKELVREYILENPTIIPEAVQILRANDEKNKVAEEKKAAEKRVVTIKARKDELNNPAEGTIIGNPKGDVTVTEFFDYNCGYCKRMFPTMMDAVKADSKIRLVMKEFPILGPSSLAASRAALAARKQGKYPEFHMALLSYKGQLTDAAIMQVAKDVGLDTKKLQDDMKAPEITAIIDKNHELAEALGIDGTPAMFIGGEFVPGAIEKDHLTELVADARKK